MFSLVLLLYIWKLHSAPKEGKTGSAELIAQIKGLETKISILDPERLQLKNELDSQKSEYTTLYGEYEKINQANLGLTDKNNELIKEVQEKEENISQLQNANKELDNITNSLKRDLDKLEQKLIYSENELAEKTASVSVYKDKQETDQNEIQNLKLKNMELTENNKNLHNQIESLGSQFNEFKEESKNLRETFSKEFRVVAGEVLQSNSKQFNEKSTQDLENLLQPLKSKLTDFSKSVSETYEKGLAERSEIKTQISSMLELNKKLSSGAEKLTNALRAEVKTQGNWGEQVLKRILEASGLREGHEYSEQGKGLDLRDSEGNNLKPDYIIKLPDQKHIIIDSKVSIKSFEQYVNAEDELTKQAHLKEYQTSLKNHVKGLSSKNYEGLEGASSPDFVFMFVPTDAAFYTISEKFDDFIADAWAKKVAIISPSLLFPSLKTVSSLWNMERQNRFAKDIAKQGGKIYDKFRLFVESLDDLGKKLGSAQTSYEEAVKRLRTGKDNFSSNVIKLKDMGVTVKKSLPEEHVEIAMVERNS